MKTVLTAIVIAAFVPSDTARQLTESSNAPSQCAISRVVDGDTIRCADGTRVRLLLIDAPERDQPFARNATAKLRELLPPGTEATLEFDVRLKDRYRRTLAYVYAANGRMANEEIVRGGYAVLLVLPPNVKHVERMRSAQSDARTNARGLWATRAFDCSPSDHRRHKC